MKIDPIVTFTTPELVQIQSALMSASLCIAECIDIAEESVADDEGNDSKERRNRILNFIERLNSIQDELTPLEVEFSKAFNELYDEDPSIVRFR